MRPGGIALVAALGLVAAPVAAAEGQMVADPRIALRLEGRTRDLVAEQVELARREGLPVEPLVDKALEGMSKGAATARIVSAVRSLRVELRTAREALGPQSTPGELVAGASALRAGIPVAELTRLRKMRSRKPVTIALTVVSELVTRGVPGDTAAASVAVLAQAGLADEEILAFRRGVEQEMELGTPAGTASASRALITIEAPTSATLTGTLRPVAPTPQKRRP